MIDASQIKILRAAAVEAQEKGWEITVSPADLIAIIDNMARLARAAAGKLDDAARGAAVDRTLDVRGLSRCRSCQAPIIWAKTTRGRNIPIDAAPVAGGNIEIREAAGGLLAVLNSPGDGPRYVSHFASCPAAARHRTKGDRGNA